MNKFVGLFIAVQLMLVSSHKHSLLPFRNFKSDYKFRQTNDNSNKTSSRVILNSSQQRPHGKSEVLIGYNDSNVNEYSSSNEEGNKLRNIKINKEPDIQQQLYYKFPPYGVDLPKINDNYYSNLNIEQDALVQESKSIKRTKVAPRVRDDPIQLEITDMQCDNDAQDGSFRTIIKMKSSMENAPLIEDSEDVVGERSCRVHMESPSASNEVVLRVNILSELFTICGVRACLTGERGSGSFLCLRLRFPTIHNLRLADDPILTLQCKTRDAVVTNTKMLYMPVTHKKLSSRMSGTIAAGGADDELHPQVALFRRPQGVSTFSQMVQPGETILLGEELMLKATLDSKQGWAFSRMGNIALRQGEDAVMVLDDEGCVNTEMRPICPVGPVEQTPLVHTLLMRAATFRNTKENEVVKLSVQILACIKQNDCTSACVDYQGRYRRGAIAVSDFIEPAPVWNTTSELSYIVISPKSLDEDSDDGIVYNTVRVKGTVIFLVAAVTVCAVIGLFGIFRWYIKVNKRFYGSYNC